MKEQWRWISEQISPDKVDDAIAYMTYHITGLMFVLAMATLIVAVWAIRTPTREAATSRRAEADSRKAEAEARRAETREREIDRSLDMIRILTGNDPKGKTTVELQIAVMEILKDYPQYYLCYISMREFWSSSKDDFYGRASLLAAINDLIKKTKPVK